MGSSARNRKSGKPAVGPVRHFGELIIYAPGMR
jgi:hypothetical protein